MFACTPPIRSDDMGPSRAETLDPHAQTTSNRATDAIYNFHISKIDQNLFIFTNQGQLETGGDRINKTAGLRSLPNDLFP